MIPGTRYFRDHDRAVSRRYGAVGADGEYRCVTYLLDPSLRVLAVIPFPGAGVAHAADLLARLDRLPAMPDPWSAAPPAPVLVLPRIFEPDFCRTLVDYYQARGGEGGLRYMFLPFLYDEPARRIREENLRFLDTGPADGPPS